MIGDELVGKAAAKQKWDSLQNVTLKISYPREGVVGKLINYVEIRVNQVNKKKLLNNFDLKNNLLNEKKNIFSEFNFEQRYYYFRRT